MEIEYKITIDLDPEDIRKILKEHFKEKYEISLIGFEIGNKSIGYGMNESSVDYFKGVKLTAKVK